jgi:Tol biopolymer transport system component
MHTHTTLARPLALLGLVALAGACGDTTTPVAPVVPTAPSLAKGGPSVPPTNGRIYFASSFAGAGFDLYSMNADGSDRRRLTLTGDSELFVNVSPDGKKLVVGSHRANSAAHDLLTMNVDGTNRRVLVSADGLLGYPAYSPDGRTIAYVAHVSSAPNTLGIWAVSGSGGKATVLTSPTESASDPSWSPDGKRIVYWSGAPGTVGGGDLYTMNADGSGRQLLHDCAEACATPVWSPDGSRIIYVEVNAGVLRLRSCYLNAGPQCGIPVINSGNPRRVAISPDGSKLVYMSTDFVEQWVTTSNINGTEQTVLTANLFSIAAVAWGR